MAWIGMLADPGRLMKDLGNGQNENFNAGMT